MSLSTTYEQTEPSRDEIASFDGPVVVEFGSPTCGYCRAAQPHIAQAFAHHQDVHHLKIADGSGRPLGRSFNVKLWPTLVFLKDGSESARLVRPDDAAQIKEALRRIAA